MGSPLYSSPSSISQPLSLFIDCEQNGPSSSSASLSQFRQCPGALHLSDALSSANVSPNCQDEVGETALHVAVRNNCFVSVRRLVHAGASVDARSYNQWTPVHFAARYGQVSVLRELIRNTADVNLRGFHGWTALHYAARSGYLEAIELLLSAGAEVNALDNDKRTAAQEAIQFHHYDVLRVLEDDPMR